ncbi:hypothetical protein [Psychrobacter sp. P11G3]|uniref:hypothetical protein n=1 Tax=Psychrobacter sp. P11G3 TaxID=1699623 RepID=UPI00070DB740|nr:hypothetical protein [Psychrobacter sp. P11G3]KRG36253.1 hypothetical protein AK824_03560 [Psychrobacter sp. P11G3]
MKILSIAMVASALVLASASSSADPSLDGFKMQKPMEMSSVAYSKVMQLSFNNKERYTSEKEIYEKVMRGAKANGFELKEVEAMKIAHIVDGALDNEPPEAASINITVTIHLKRPIKIEVEISL